MSESNSVPMTTTESSDIDINTQERDATLVLSAGELLKREREAAGLHIGALAVLLKVPVKKLEALESGRLDLLPDVVFARALAASICRTLKLDVVKVLEMFPSASEPKLGQQAVRAAPPFHAAAAGATRPGAGRSISRTALLAGTVLVVGALVLVFLPTIKTIFVGVAPATVSSPSVIFQPESNPDSSAATTTDNGVTTFGPISALPVDTLLTPVVAASAPAAATSSPAAVAGVVFATPAPPVATIANASSAPSASAALTPSAKALLVLTAKTMSWAQVTDAGGQILLSRNLESGEAIGLSGALPLAVIVGRVNAVEVQVRGKPFDLSLYARENVARFEVK